MGNRKRVKQGIFYGILYVEIIMLIGLAGLELFADPLIGLFAMLEETERLCVMGTKIIAVSFLFAGGNIWAFPIAEFAALAAAVFFMRRIEKKILRPIENRQSQAS